MVNIWHGVICTTRIDCSTYILLLKNCSMSIWTSEVIPLQIQCHFVCMLALAGNRQFIYGSHCSHHLQMRQSLRPLTVSVRRSIGLPAYEGEGNPPGGDSYDAGIPRLVHASPPMAGSDAGQRGRERRLRRSTAKNGA